MTKITKERNIVRTADGGDFSAVDIYFDGSTESVDPEDTSYIGDGMYIGQKAYSFKGTDKGTTYMWDGSAWVSQAE